MFQGRHSSRSRWVDAPEPALDRGSRVILGFYPIDFLAHSAMWLALLTLLSLAPCLGFDDKTTHRILTQSATEASSLGSVLKDELSQPDGIDASFADSSGKRQQVIKWLQDGSTREDADDVCRASNHFHNPLQPYPSAGMTDPSGVVQLRCGTSPPYGQRLSSAIWGTKFKAPKEKEKDPDRSTGNTQDWDAARSAFMDALTLGTKAEREAALAKTFLYLGYVMHLVQDLAVPAHTRDDFVASHLQLNPTGPWPNQWVNEGFEGFVKTHSGLVLGASATAVPTPDNSYVTRFWDTGRYRETQIPSVDTDQGLAEYTNANFLGLGTSFQRCGTAICQSPVFPNPALDDTDLPELIQQRKLFVQFTSEDGIRDTGLYLQKYGEGVGPEGRGHGETINDFLKPAYFYSYAQTKNDPNLLGLTFQFDENVLASYASKLIPRAIGYSAALLDYFFRGKLDFTVQPNPNQPGQIDLTISNKSTEMMTGTFTLYTEDQKGIRVPVPGASVTNFSLPGTAGGGFTPDPGLTPLGPTITFTPDPGVKLGGLTLVFSGTLGAEEGAVVGKVKAWEPAIFVIQTFAESTGGEHIETHTPLLDPETGKLYDWNDPYADSIRSKDPRLQRAGGYFLSSDESAAGGYIKRIWLPAGQGVALLLNGATNVGVEWSRDTGPALVPNTWEIVIDQAHVSDPQEESSLPPSLFVETLNGKVWETSLAWWKGRKSVGSARIDYTPWACMTSESVLAASTSSTTTWAAVSLSSVGDPKFIPMQGIAGLEVGACVPDTGSLIAEWNEKYPPPCPGNASRSHQSASVFSDACSNPRNSAMVTQGQESLAWLDWSHAGDPPTPPPAPELVGELKFRRQYLSSEVAWYRQLGVTPPEYEIELR